MQRKFKYLLCGMIWLHSLPLVCEAKSLIADSSQVVYNPQLSDNGQYFACTIENVNDHISSLLIRRTDNSWSKKILNSSTSGSFFFHQRFVFKKGDSLGILDLKTHIVNWIAGTRECNLSPAGSLLVIRYKSGSLSLLDKMMRIRATFAGVTSFKFSKDDKIYYVATRNAASQDEITLSSLLQEKQVAIKLPGVKTAVFLDDWHQRIFIECTDNLEQSGKRIVLEMDLSGRHTKCMSIDTTLYKSFTLKGLTDDRRHLVFTFHPEVEKEKTKGIQIWRYDDFQLPTGLTTESQLYATMDITSGKVTIINHENEHLNFDNVHDGIWNHFNLLVGKHATGNDEWHWNPRFRSAAYIVNMYTGQRTLIGTNVGGPILRSYQFSPDQKYLIYYNEEKESFYVVNTATKVTHSLTRSKKINWIAYGGPLARNQSESAYLPLPIARWDTLSSTAYAYDQFDIWKLDLKGNEAPVSITKSKGILSGVIFRLINDQDYSRKSYDPSFLCAFDTKTKEAGFYRLKKSGVLQKINMGNLVYNPESALDFSLIGNRKSGFLVNRSSIIESPNFYYTKDFLSFRQLTNANNSAQYKSYKVDLVKLPLNDHNNIDAVLYQPKYLVPGKRYPAILVIYETFSDDINLPQSIGLSNGGLNIPYFVDKGYIILTPDIHYKIGSPGESALTSVLGAYNFLKRQSYIDSSAVGIQGHSFGAFEVNYVVTHSNKFAAAVSTSGASDAVSGYNSIAGGLVRQYKYEMGQYRFGGSLWDNLDTYFDNSPILFVNQVNTPILLMNNDNDASVPSQQGIEFFLGLRRNSKPAWLLKYAQEGHILSQMWEKDFTARVESFFDHFLKHQPAPEWLKSNN